MSTHVIATAGHVDHGKSTLVRALTGMDPDRLSEEKERGLTIDLGFAWSTLPSGREVAFVDVPGHVRFLKNMLAGVGSVRACLFVVAATEGWKPQSEEHLRILELLGITDGVVALTKVAVADDETRELARLELEEHLAGSFLASRKRVEVDAPAGIGLAELTEALDALTASMPSPGEAGRPRLFVDRSFPVRGSGTVVTGTLTGGRLAVGDRLEVVPGPGPRHEPVAVRVRGLQSHRRTLSEATPGRVAVNLSGVSHGEVVRGQALVAPGQWEPTMTFDASLSVLASLDHEVSRRGAYWAYIGSGQHPVRLRLLGESSLAPGETGAVRIHADLPLPLLPGDRYVLRESGRSETVGGGEVLDVMPVRRAAEARPDRSVARVVSERGFVEAGLLWRLTGERLSADLGGRWVADAGARAAAEERLRRAVVDAGSFGLELATLSEIDRAVVAAMADLAVSGGTVRLRSAVADGEDRLDRHPFVMALEAEPFRPPSPADLSVDRAELRRLVTSGRVVESGGCYFARSAIAEASRRVAALLARQPAGATVAQIRDELGTSRKYLLPLLAALDSSGVTRRRADLRVGGPRLPLEAAGSAADESEGGC